MSKTIAEVRDLAKIVHTNEETGKTRAKHLHDACGIFAAKLMSGPTLTGQEIADHGLIARRGCANSQGRC